MAGTYDFALIVRGESMQDIAMFVAKKLSTIDGVLSTGTHFIMRRYKDREIQPLQSPCRVLPFRQSLFPFWELPEVRLKPQHSCRQPYPSLRLPDSP